MTTYNANYIIILMLMQMQDNNTHGTLTCTFTHICTTCVVLDLEGVQEPLGYHFNDISIQIHSSVLYNYM